MLPRCPGQGRLTGDPIEQRVESIVLQRGPAIAAAKPVAQANARGNEIPKTACLIRSATARRLRGPAAKRGPLAGA